MTRVTAIVMAMTTMNCEIYRSGKKAEMYLYVDPNVGLQGLPGALVQQFGKAEFVMTLELTPEKKLARADARQVLKSLQQQGYYLQMPPQAEGYLQAINSRNAKLAK